MDSEESADGDGIETEIIEVGKSKKSGKKAFLDIQGNECSTEDAAKNYFQRLGYVVLRGEVQFWQAMFGLSFWEEIFAETGTPNLMNDIPLDLFRDEQFYTTRKSRIDRKAELLNKGGLVAFISEQLNRYGSIWTRIVYSGGREDFSYRSTLQSEEVNRFLNAIDPVIFSKVVYRIAINPNQNRAGVPDYMIWKGSAFSFIEVKGVREKVRESQLSWLHWMKAEGIPAKIVRVKGKALDF